MTVDPLPYRLERTIVIRASRDTVFAFFTDSGLWASWWGAGSHIDGRPEAGCSSATRTPSRRRGKSWKSPHPNESYSPTATTRGLQHRQEARASRLRSSPLQKAPGCTSCTSSHRARGATSTSRAGATNWRCSETSSPTTRTRTWRRPSMAGWRPGRNQTRPAGDAAIAALTTPGVVVRDRFSLLSGREDLLPHLDAVQRFMPGLTLRRDGGARHCQGTVLADWVARNTAGEEKARGTNVLRARRRRTD